MERGCTRSAHGHIAEARTDRSTGYALSTRTRRSACLSIKAKCILQKRRSRFAPAGRQLASPRGQRESFAVKLSVKLPDDLLPVDIGYPDVITNLPPLFRDQVAAYAYPSNCIAR